MNLLHTTTRKGDGQSHKANERSSCLTQLILQSSDYPSSELMSVQITLTEAINLLDHRAQQLSHLQHEVNRLTNANKTLQSQLEECFHAKTNLKEELEITNIQVSLLERNAQVNSTRISEYERMHTILTDTIKDLKSSQLFNQRVKRELDFTTPVQVKEEITV